MNVRSVKIIVIKIKKALEIDTSTIIKKQCHNILEIAERGPTSFLAHRKCLSKAAKS
jgi:hypothetical protein